jgi:hypothetical protein
MTWLDLRSEIAAELSGHCEAERARPVACECGERFATEGGLIGHVRFCRAEATK